MTDEEQREDDIFWHLNKLENDMLFHIIDEWQANKGKEHVYQFWRVIPAGMLVKEWKYAANTGMVHDKNIDKMQSILIDNFLKLKVNTILFGHTSIDPYGYAEIALPEGTTEDEFDTLLEDFEWFACDQDGNWRISDYALDKLEALITELLMTDDGKTKLYIMDKILQIAHQRSDFASWMVEGGIKTLNHLFVS